MWPVAFSPNGQTLATGSIDRTIRIWDICNGQCLKILQGHGRILASASDDQTIRFWDTETGECLKILTNERPYEGMNITNVVGVSEAQRAALKALGAID